MLPKETSPRIKSLMLSLFKSIDNTVDPACFELEIETFSEPVLGR